MTHSLHRKGLSVGKPGEEMVVLCMVHSEQKKDGADDLVRAAEILLNHSPANFIGSPLGFSDEDVISWVPGGGIFTAVYTDFQEVVEVVSEIRSEDLDISVTLSGLFDDVHKICSNTGLTEHTYNCSLGIHGEKEKLPDEKILEITTQCGHGLVSSSYVKHIAKKIEDGKMTISEGAKKITKPCVCGIVNPKRTEKILREIVQSE